MKDRSIHIMPDFGKVPPQAIDVETALLSICLTSPGAIYETGLKPEMFYKEAHRLIFQAAIDLLQSGPVDIITVTNKLRNNNQLEAIGGPVYISQITSAFYSDSMTAYYSAIIKQKYIQREFIRYSSELQTRSFDDSLDLFDLVEFAETGLFNITNFSQKKEPLPLSKCVDEFLIEVEKIYNKEKELTGIPSGYTRIDRITGGWMPGDLIIVAARPSMGKTAFALNLAKNIASFKYPIAVFSLEMSYNQLVSRLLSGESGYSNVEIRNANINFDKLVESSHSIASLPVFIDDTPGLSLFELRSKVKKLIIKQGIKMIIIDYLQLMTNKSESREQEISSISRGLKLIAKEFDIPVIALSQLNREVENTKEKRPKLSNLRESGAIEQDADIVCFLFRPYLYDILEIYIDDSNQSTKDMLIVDCAKDRNGALFSIPLFHNDAMTIIKENKEDLNNEQCTF